ncbi:hypothetical protein ACFVYR_36005 [Streptomyces sp. NPDC058284]|uniref:hypothetical protein n=1 Tax=unclassified Streptomyces TaxID=2593676 RepID=UPI00366273A7
MSSRHCWRLSGGETPLPDLVPRETDMVRVGWGLGMASIDAMIDIGEPVGPLLCCTLHKRLLVPVVSGTASWWSAPHSDYGRGRMLHCSLQGPESVCVGRRFWVLPPEPRVYATTDPQRLYDSLGLTRTQLRHTTRQTAGAGPRVVCHV